MNYLGERPGRPVASRSLVDVLQSTDRGVDAIRRQIAVDVLPGGDRTPAAVALIAPPWKLVHDLSRNAWELYDLDRDSEESHNLYDALDDVAGDLRDRLDDAVDDEGDTDGV